MDLDSEIQFRCVSNGLSVSVGVCVCVCVCVCAVTECSINVREDYNVLMQTGSTAAVKGCV